MQSSFAQTPHRRFNPLTGEWILVSPQRTLRPWAGLQEDDNTSIPPQYDANCYLCPGNIRAGGSQNPSYSNCFVFNNDFAALTTSHTKQSKEKDRDELFLAEEESGVCRVICYSPRHDLTMARMSKEQIEAIITTWQQEFITLSSLPEINYVQIFENKGLIMGCSNPHPHGQIWASSKVPTLPATECIHQANYLQKHSKCLLCTYLEREISDGTRLLFDNDSFVALIPYWATWPFEAMVLPRRHAASIEDITAEEVADLAEIMKSLTICYDNLFNTSFPYSMGFHQKPTDGAPHDCFHYHIHFLPPLLRSATVKKHMVGYELLAMAQRDLTPEMAVEKLRTQPIRHYLEGGTGV